MSLGLGSWRFFLAFLVAISHLYKDMIHGPAAYAVWGFFLLSGYLMTYVLTEKYGLSRKGLFNFATNRFLRIYPPYAVACVLGMLTISLLPLSGIDPASLNPQFKYPANMTEWIANIFMLFALPQSGLLVPVAGALYVEVGAYALMPFFAASRTAAILGCLIAFFVNFQFGFTGESFIQRYAGFATGLLPFAVGSLICHYRRTLHPFATPTYSILAWMLFCLVWLAFPSFPWTYGLPLSVLLSAWVVISLAERQTGRIDKLIGDLSYPLYLLHTTVGAWWILHYGENKLSLPYFAASFATTLVISYVFVRLIDIPLQQRKIKPQPEQIRHEPPGTFAEAHSR